MTMPCTGPAASSRRALLLTLAAVAMLGACAEEAPRRPPLRPRRPSSLPRPRCLRPPSRQPAPRPLPPPARWNHRPCRPDSGPRPSPPREIALTWQPSTSTAGPVVYEVFRGQDRIARTEQTSAVDPRLRPGTRYGYVVRAVDPAGRPSAPSAGAWAQTLDTSPPSVPSGVVARARPSSIAEISWGPSTDDAGDVRYEVFREGVRIATVKDTVLKEGDLVALKELCWTVIAVDAAGNRSESSAPACVVMPDITPPTVPQRVTAGASGERAVEVTWESSRDDAGVARYEIQRDGAPVLTATESAVQDRGLAPARRYCYAVRACDAAGNCSSPAPEACATTPDHTPPTRPPTFEALARSDVAVELAWAQSSDEVGVVGYELKRGDKVLAAAQPGLAFTEGGLKPFTKYCWTLLAIDAAGNRSPSAQACATTPDLTPPTAPGRPAAVSVSSSQLFVGWDPSTDDVGVVGYEVLRDGAPVAKVTTTRMRDLGLPATREFCYTVRAIDAAGNRSEAGGLACAVTADPSQLASPSDLRVVRVSATEVLLQWEPSEVEGVTYVIYADGTKRIGLTRWNTYNASGRLGAQANCYRVAAQDDKGRESSKSNEVCARLSPGQVTHR